ncbi:MAG: DUF4065 domain-containing protein [Prevotellaceae bacterium]|jgi:uncharacterized phage-associated protein|nr:DUF4065 domain-containing protein [Prevotellaceae bacterium]
MVDIKNIMQIVILYCQSQGYTINPLKLQKLLYFVQAWHIVTFDKNTLFQELPEAWVNGPVYRSIYDIYKTKFYRNDNFIDTECNTEEKLHEKLDKLISASDLSDKQQELLFSVLKVYGAMSDEKLVFATHNAEPWNNARKGYKPFERCNEKISVNDMYNYYSQK